MFLIRFCVLVKDRCLILTSTIRSSRKIYLRHSKTALEFSSAPGLSALQTDLDWRPGVPESAWRYHYSCRYEVIPWIGAAFAHFQKSRRKSGAFHDHSHQRAVCRSVWIFPSSHCAERNKKHCMHNPHANSRQQKSSSEIRTGLKKSHLNPI